MADTASVVSPDTAASQFRQAMSLLAGAVNVVATGSVAGGPATWHGMTATAVCSVCAEPPSIVVCLNRAAGTCQHLLATGIFSVNVLSTRHIPIAQMFAGEDSLVGADRFKDPGWNQGRLGEPVLDDAVASLECRTARFIEHGTHALIIGRVEVISWAVPEETAEPLVYHGRRFVGVTDLDTKRVGGR